MSKLLNKQTPTVRELAQKYKVSAVEVMKQLMHGVKVEKEHTDSAKVAREIALDHLGEKLDYYRKLSKIDEETGVGSVRGLGYVSGDPAIADNDYCNTNALAYDSLNGARLQFMKKVHTMLHNQLFKSYDPTNIKNSKNVVNEGISAGPEREVPIIGDVSGASRKVSKVEKEQVSDPRYTERPTYEENKYPNTAERSIYQEDWSDKKHQNPTGGLKKSGVMAYRRENPGSKLQTAVTTKPSKLKRGSKSANRRKSFCARMGGMKKRLTSAKTANDPDSRINKALRKWNCEESNHKHIHINKPDTKREPGAEGLTHTIYEVTKMENKDLINEAIESIVENDLPTMKENLMAVLQEKAVEKLEERKKEIAAHYFAQ